MAYDKTNKTNQEGESYRFIDETKNSPRRAQGSAEVDGQVGPMVREKYRIGNAQSPKPKGRSRMRMLDYTKANRTGLQMT